MKKWASVCGSLIYSTLPAEQVEGSCGTWQPKTSYAIMLSAPCIHMPATIKGITRDKIINLRYKLEQSHQQNYVNYTRSTPYMKIVIRAK